MDTVEEALEYIAPYAGETGACSDEEALDALNEARRLLWSNTKYRNITEYICIKCPDGCFYLPSAYKQVMLAWMGNVPVSLGDEWYQSLPGVGLDESESCHRKITDVGGYHVTFQNYTERPYYIAVQLENNADTGTVITVFGVDPNGSKRKEVLTTKVSPNKVKTKRRYTAVTAVIKPKTEGRVRLYAIDPENGNYMLLAIYQPYDENPSFRKYRVAGPKCPTMTLLVKKKFYKLEGTHELVEFPQQALTFAAMANTFKRARDNEGFLTNRELAFAELDLDQKDMEINSTQTLRFMHNNLVQNLL